MTETILFGFVSLVTSDPLSQVGCESESQISPKAVFCLLGTFLLCGDLDGFICQSCQPASAQSTCRAQNPRRRKAPGRPPCVHILCDLATFVWTGASIISWIRLQHEPFSHVGCTLTLSCPRRRQLMCGELLQEEAHRAKDCCLAKDPRPPNSNTANCQSIGETDISHVGLHNNLGSKRLSQRHPGICLRKTRR